MKNVVNKTKTGLKGLAYAGIGLASLLYSGKAEAGNMIIESVADRSVVARGENVRIDVYADSRQIPDKKIRAGQWRIWQIPSYLTLTSATLPDGTNYTSGPSTEPEDFYFDFLMWDIYNHVDTSVVGGELDDNVRDVDINDGPQNKRGTLGSFWFDIAPNASVGQEIANLRAVSFYDTDYAGYDVMNENLTIIETPFNIVQLGDANGDGFVDGNDLSAIIGNWGMSGATRAQGDLNNDGKVGGADYNEVLTYWGQGTPPPEPGAIPEAGTLISLLSGAGAATLAGRRRQRRN